MRRISRSGRMVAAVLLAGLTAAACREQIESAENGLPVTSSSTSTPADSSVAPGSSLPGTTTSTTSASTSSTSSTTSTSTTSTTTTTTLPPVPTTTSCEQVVHIGDSTSVGLFDSAQVGGDELTIGVDPDKECYPSGQGVGAITKIEPAGDIVRRLVAEAEAALERTSSVRAASV